MTTATNLSNDSQDSNYYQRGLELAEAGRYQEALTCIEQHLRTAPNDGQALNDAGVILHCLGRSGEAVDRLVQARNLQGSCAEIVWNLVEAYLAEGRANEAARLFDDMQWMGILNVDVLNRAANVFVNQNNNADAIETLLRSLQVAPQQEVLRPMIDVIRSKRPKIAFFCALDGEKKSFRDIYEFAKQRFPVQFFESRSADERPNEIALGPRSAGTQMYELMKWSDISWFEGCTDMVVEASKQPKVCKIIARPHEFEAEDNWVGQVQWENIDIMMVGSSFVKEALRRCVPDFDKRTRLVTIPNGIDLDTFKFIDRRRGKNLACVGNLNLRYNPMLLLQCMQKLHYIDREYKLFFAGTFQSSILEQYIRHIVRALELTEVVFFDGWQEDVNSWLQDKHYIICGSIAESQDMGLLEGMACGLKPVIHNFPGAGAILPCEFLFNISEEFCRQILSDMYEPARYRRFVEENYPLKNQLSKINDILTQLEEWQRQAQLGDGHPQSLWL